MPDFGNRVGIALIISIVLSILIVLFSTNSRTSALLRGDFPGFYVLGSIVAQNKSDDLYNLELQRKIQNLAWPELAGSFLISVYPPSLAILLAPLGFLNPRTAQLIFTLLSCAGLFLSFLALKNRSDFLKKSPYLLFALIITNPFVLIGTIGGQNTAFSIAILTSGMFLIEKMNQSSSKFTGIMAGIVFSLWLFKPQFGIFLIPGFVFFRLWSPLLGFLGGAIGHYIAGVILLGPDWPISWIRKLIEFSSINYLSNSTNQASIIGTFNVVFRQAGLNQELIAAISFLGILLLTSAALYLLSKRIGTQPQSIGISFWVFLGTIPLIAPQTLYYDIGIIFMCLMNSLKGLEILRYEKLIFKLMVLIQLLALFLTLYRDSVSVPIFAVPAALYACIAVFSALKQKKTLL